MNVAAHQKKKQNEKTGKREAKKEERKQPTDFGETSCCPCVIVQRAARRKNGLYKGSARGDWVPREDQEPFQPNSNKVGDRTIRLRRLLIGATAKSLAIQTLNTIFTTNRKYFQDYKYSYICSVFQRDIVK